MLTKTTWLLAGGALAYLLEYGLGLTEAIPRIVAYLIGVPVLVLVAMDALPIQLSGRLKGARDIESAASRKDAAPDIVFHFTAILYACVYLSVLFRFRPRNCDLFFDMFFTLSPVELFWLVAPIVSFWWYRLWAIKRRGNAA